MDINDNASENSSFRLKELLKSSGRFQGLGRGLTKEVSDTTGYSYNAVRKWLYEDSLPRTADERVSVSKMLSIDLLYWEYGLVVGGNESNDLDNDNVFHLKLSNQLMTILYENNLKITNKKKEEIERLSLIITKESRRSEPDVDILKGLVNLVVA